MNIMCYIMGYKKSRSRNRWWSQVKRERSLYMCVCMYEWVGAWREGGSQSGCGERLPNVCRAESGVIRWPLRLKLGPNASPIAYLSLTAEGKVIGRLQWWGDAISCLRAFESLHTYTHRHTTLARRAASDAFVSAAFLDHSCFDPSAVQCCLICLPPAFHRTVLRLLSLEFCVFSPVKARCISDSLCDLFYQWHHHQWFVHDCESRSVSVAEMLFPSNDKWWRDAFYSSGEGW